MAMVLQVKVSHNLKQQQQHKKLCAIAALATYLSSKTKQTTMASDEENEEEADVAAMLDLTKKKKKKKKTKKAEGGKAQPEGGAGDTDAGKVPVDASEQQRLLAELDGAQEVGDPNDRKADYTYEELLERVVELLMVNNPDLVEKKRTRIKPPQMQTISSRKCMWVNFQEICSMMQRDPQHVYQFFMTELGTEGSIDGNQRLIIRKYRRVVVALLLYFVSQVNLTNHDSICLLRIWKHNNHIGGRYLPKYIESLLRKYVVEYVTCGMCRSPNTDLVKDQGSRLYFCNCRDCGSSRSVAPIKAGYHATNRADRRAARNKT